MLAPYYVAPVLLFGLETPGGSGHAFILHASRMQHPACIPLSDNILRNMLTCLQYYRMSQLHAGWGQVASQLQAGWGQVFFQAGMQAVRTMGFVYWDAVGVGYMPVLQNSSVKPLFSVY